MGCIVEGVDHLRWTAPEWVARNAVFFLLPHLDRSDAARAIAERLSPIIESRQTYVDLADLLAGGEATQLWHNAVTQAEEEIAAEDPALWNDPNAYLPFRTAFARLKLLAPQNAQGKPTTSTGLSR